MSHEEESKRHEEKKSHGHEDHGDHEAHRRDEKHPGHEGRQGAEKHHEGDKHHEEAHGHRHDKPHDEPSHHEHHPHGHPMLHLIVIVNGVPANVEVPALDKLLVAADKALMETQNMGRPISDWEMKLGDRILPLEERMDRLGLKNGDKLFLSLKAGVGGLN